LIVVYDDNDEYYASDVYTFNSSFQELASGEDGGISVDGLSTYRFVACTYNDTDSVPTDTVSISSISPEYDLLYGRTNPIQITSDNQRINIGVSHQFMKVCLTTTITGDGAPELSGLSASFTTNYTANLSVLDGALAKDTLAAAYDFTGSNLTGPSASLNSDYGVVYSGGKDTCYVKIDSLTLSPGGPDVILTDMVASFTKPLLPGHSYTLQINFKKGVGWAGSNIYWDGSKLTFKEAGYKGPENYYQGVFFKFGSLVGVSPARLPSGTTFSGGTNGNSATGTPIYVWSSLDSQWIQTNVATANATGLGGFSGSGYPGIPYKNTGTANDRYSNSLYGAGGDFATNRGDICEYIGLKGGPQGYRMAKSMEFAPGGQTSKAWNEGSPDTGFGWIRLGTSWSSVSDNSHPGGTLMMTNGGSYQTYPFPVSGGRDGTTGELGPFVGTFGFYWSSSTNSDKGFSLDFLSSNIYLANSTVRLFGYAVRCVLQE
jgi:hypothetical protein